MGPPKIDAADARTRILDAAADQLRRHGPAKTGVVDIARALGVSHAAVYRHFPSKEALFDAVAERWLVSVSKPLQDIAGRRGKPVKRIEDWLTALSAIKRSKFSEDPELFATYQAVEEGAHTVVAAHVAELQEQLGRIIADGVAAGDFKVSNTAKAAMAVLYATAYFHHPYFVRKNSADPEAERRVIRLVLGGLATGDIER